MNELETKQLKELAIWLEGLKQGQGHIEPLGTEHLKTLWYAVAYWQKINK